MTSATYRPRFQICQSGGQQQLPGCYLQPSIQAALPDPAPSLRCHHSDAQSDSRFRFFAGLLKTIVVVLSFPILISISIFLSISLSETHIHSLHRCTNHTVSLTGVRGSSSPKCWWQLLCFWSLGPSTAKKVSTKWENNLKDTISPASHQSDQPHAFCFEVSCALWQSSAATFSLCAVIFSHLHVPHARHDSTSLRHRERSSAVAAAKLAARDVFCDDRWTRFSALFTAASS